MSTTYVEASSIRGTKSQESTLWLLGLGTTILVLWSLLVAKLTTDWSTNQQYEFGAFVPFFILVLLVSRWNDRPPREQSHNVVILITTALVLIASMFPLRVFEVASPDWRPLNWLHTAVVVGLTLLLIVRLGGGAWLRHFSAPLVLIFFAVPWPLAVEEGVIQLLTRGVTAATVEFLTGCGIPALQRGNMIEVPTGYVGINEACSGIRSLAGNLMAAAFFGELYRMTWWRRGALIMAAALVAFMLNLVRAFILSWLQAVHGAEAHHTWHDTTGLVIFGASFAILWWIAVSLGGGKQVNLWPLTPGGMAGGMPPAKLLPIRLLGAVLVCLIATEVATEWWYRTREGHATPAPAWYMRWPAVSAAFEFEEIPEETKSILRYSEGTAAVLKRPGEPTFSIYLLEWAPGRTSAQLAVMHRPEICVAAKGIQYIAPTAPLNTDISGVKMPFTGTIFDDAGRQLFVYRCLWEDKLLGDHLSTRSFDMSIRGRLASAWYGRRNLGQKLLQIAIVGADSEAEARESLVGCVRELVIMPNHLAGR